MSVYINMLIYNKSLVFWCTQDIYQQIGKMELTANRINGSVLLLFVKISSLNKQIYNKELSVYRYTTTTDYECKEWSENYKKKTVILLICEKHQHCELI